MVDANAIIAFLKRDFPSPEPDPNWIRQCIQALIDDGQQSTPDAVREQYIFSDLASSTLPLPTPSSALAGRHNVLLFPQPTLFQVVAITEIGSSAFQLQTVVEQRRDVLDGVTRIRGMDDENEQEVDEGKLPAYPRSMLRLELSDGRGRIKAIEYRRVENLRLGETALGTKVVLHRVKALRGLLLLTSENCTVVGGMVEDLEAAQPAQFVAGLKARLEAAANPPKPAGRQIKARTRAPVAQATKPPAGPSRARQVKVEPKASQRTEAVYISDDDAKARVRQPSKAAAAVRGSTKRRPVVEEEDFDDFDFQPDESFFRNVAALEATASNTQGQDDFDDDFGADESFFRHIDEVEMAATQRSSGRGGTAGDGRKKARVVAGSAGPSRAHGTYNSEIIEISD